MPHATATVNGIVVAETDNYEVVDGNIYVPHPDPYPNTLFPFKPLTQPSSHPTPSKVTTSPPQTLKHTVLTKATQATTPSQPTRRK
jgi:hypothetical protein